MSSRKWFLVSIFSFVALSSIPALAIDQSDPVKSQPVEKLQSSTEIISTTLNLKTKPRVALALGGGGCKCMAEIGVLRVLDANKIPIDYIVGTSTGATIGAMYAAGISVDEIQRLYVDGIVQKAMIPGMIPRLIFFPAAQIKRDITRKGEAGITDGARFKTFLEKTLPAKFSDLKIPFSAVTTDLVSGYTFVYSGGNLPLAVQASNSLPPLYKPIPVDGKLLVDGALRALVPTRRARASGADLVIAVDVSPLIKEEKSQDFAVLKNVLLRVSDIGVMELNRRQDLETDILIQPETNGITIMTHDKALLEEAIKHGESAATQALPQIKQALQQHGIASTNSDL